MHPVIIKLFLIQRKVFELHFHTFLNIFVMYRGVSVTCNAQEMPQKGKD
jgi:hypothetical protein